MIVIDQLKRLTNRIRQSPSMVAPSHRKLSGRLFSSMISPTWSLWQQDASFSSYVDEGFSGNALLYSALMYKARAVCAAPPCAFVGTGEEMEPAPDDHPLNQLLRKPNPGMSKLEWLQLVTIYFNIAGEAFILFDRETDGEIPLAMYPLRPDKVIIIPSDDGKRIEGYAYNATGRKEDLLPIIPDDMMHVKLPNPADQFAGMGHGMSPFHALAQSADVDNDMTRFLKSFFERGAMTAGMLTFEYELDDETIQRLKRRWAEQYGGVDKWTDIGILDSRVSYERLTPTFDEMGFNELDARNEARILMPFGVPPILVGAKIGLDRATYSNYEQARQAFWEDTLDPELKLFEAEYDFFVAPGDGAFIRHDRSQAPALRQDIMAQTEAAQTLWQMGVPAQIAFQVAGLRVPEYKGNEVSYVNTGGISQSTPAADLTPDAPELPGTISNDIDISPDDETGEVPKKKDYDTRALETKLLSIADRWEPEFMRATNEAFEEDKRYILALIAENQREALRRKAMPNWVALQREIADYFKDATNETWSTIFAPVIKGTIGETGDQWSSTLGVQFDVRNLDAEAWFSQYVMTFAQPISETSNDVLHEVVAQGMAQGWSTDQLTNYIGDVFDQWMQGNLSAEDFAWLEARLPVWRQELIARTESMRALNTGTFELGKRWGVREKEWLSTMDDRTRDSHKSPLVNGQRRAIDQPFDVNGYQMMHPLDMNLGAPLSEVANCRCTTLLHR